MDNQRFHVGYVGQQREDTCRSVDKVFRILFAALDVECEDGPSTVREVLVIQILVAGFSGRDGWLIFLYLRVVCFRYSITFFVFSTCLSTLKGQCFQSLQQEERIEWRKSCSCISQQDRTDLRYECCRSNCFCECSHHGNSDSAQRSTHTLPEAAQSNVPPSTIAPPRCRTVTADEFRQAEWKTMSAPCSIGRIRFGGVPKVLSTTSGRLHCHVSDLSQPASISGIRSEFGLPRTSM